MNIENQIAEMWDALAESREYCTETEYDAAYEEALAIENRLRQQEGEIKVGMLVDHNDFLFPAKVAGKYPGGGWRLTGFRATGVNPNRVYLSEELRLLTEEDKRLMSENDLRCIDHLLK